MSILPATYDLYSPPSAIGPLRVSDYLRLPDDSRCELIYGIQYMSPSPTALHQRVLRVLARWLEQAAEQAGGEVFFAPLDVTLAEHSVVQPDLLYVSPERRSIIGDRIEGAPDLIVEIVSPTTVLRDRGAKLRLYAEAGVREYWLVDAEMRQIDFLVAHEGTFQVMLACDDVYRSHAMPQFELNLADLWNEVARHRPS